jgi:hypothetical protein
MSQFAKASCGNAGFCRAMDRTKRIQRDPWRDAELYVLFTMREIPSALVELRARYHDLRRFVAHFGRTRASSPRADRAKRSKKNSNGAKMTNKNTSPAKRDTHDNNSRLDSRYGSIGISAVAAALQFTREVKNPAYAAPADTTPDREKLSEMAA